MMKQIIEDMIKTHQQLLDRFEESGIDAVVGAAEMLTESLKKSGCVYLCGNGGSAADCQHIAGEFVGRFRREGRALPAVALSTDTSVLTCIGNDYNFVDIFARQVDALVKGNDVLWAFSTSGFSNNVIAAAKSAKQKGAKIIAFTGKLNSELEKMADTCLCIDSPQTSSAQEIHQLAYHIICNLVEQQFVEVK